MRCTYVRGWRRRILTRIGGRGTRRRRARMRRRIVCACRRRAHRACARRGGRRGEWRCSRCGAVGGMGALAVPRVAAALPGGASAHCGGARRARRGDAADARGAACAPAGGRGWRKMYKLRAGQRGPAVRRNRGSLLVRRRRRVRWWCACEHRTVEILRRRDVRAAAVPSTLARRGDGGAPWPTLGHPQAP